MRILYLMHIDWGWIKQRPHFIAEQLADKHKVLVAYRINPSRKRMCGNTSRLRRMPLLPIPRRWGLWSERMDSFFQKIWISLIALFFRPDVIWVTFPTIYSYIPAFLKKKPIYYDCMDDASCFYKDQEVAVRVADAEDRLVKDAAGIFCSSQTLIDRLKKRCGDEVEITLMRNGISDDLVEQALKSDAAQDLEKNGADIAYCGTISEWFDFASLVNALESLPDLKAHLIGPLDCEIPSHKRLIYHGVVDRSKLREYVQPFDAFMMPFKVNALIEGVDPVKLYEYISFGKPIVSVYYKEIERFSTYVHFYSSGEEFGELMKMLVSGGLGVKADKEKAIEFLRENTWSKRAELIEFGC
jgi:teichuronic acid biosynthesis glycosyltransferase TuaH